MQNINDIKWRVWHRRNRTPLMLHILFYGATSMKVDGFPYSIKTNGSCVGHVITSNEELDFFKERLWEKFNKEPEFILITMKKAYEQNKVDTEFWRSLLEKDYSGLPIEELENDYQNHIASVMKYASYVYFPLAIEDLLTKEIDRLLKDPKDHDVILTPVRESEMIEGKRSILQIAAGKKMEDLDKHIERFSFLKKKGMFMEFFTKDDYLKQIKGMDEPEAELKKLEDEKERKQKQFSAIMEKFPDKKDKLALQTTNEAVYFRTWRTERLIQSSYYAVPLFKEIAKRMGLADHRDVLYLLPEETIAALNNCLISYQGLIDKRKQSFVLLTGESGNTILQGDEAKKLHDKLHFFDEVDDQIKGTPAFRGRVKGRVVVVRSPEDYYKIEGADIMVVHSTVHDMVPHLNGIKAIVTDEGGILSHAAIISRELGIPSVIGTQNATKVLKDGDLIEVDANKGTVKKLS